MMIANSRNKAYIKPMTMLAFDTYRFVKDITAAGMKTEQAEVLASSYAHLVNDQLATKDDLKALKTELQKDIQVLEQRLDGKIDALEQRLDGKIDTLEQRLNARIAYAQVATIVILSAVMTLLAFFGP